MNIRVERDDNLVDQAMRVTKARTKREAVEQALRQLVGSSPKKDIRDPFGKDLIDPEL